MIIFPRSGDKGLGLSAVRFTASQSSGPGVQLDLQLSEESTTQHRLLIILSVPASSTGISRRQQPLQAGEA
jgi:hypothetical protein